MIAIIFIIGTIYDCNLIQKDSHMIAIIENLSSTLKRLSSTFFVFNGTNLSSQSLHVSSLTTVIGQPHFQYGIIIYVLIYDIFYMTCDFWILLTYEGIMSLTYVSIALYIH